MTDNSASNEDTAMTPGQEEHLASIKAQFLAAVDGKYRAGQREHGGDLWGLSPLALVDAALEEAVDAFVYLSTIRQILQSRSRERSDVGIGQ